MKLYNDILNKNMTPAFQIRYSNENRDINYITRSILGFGMCFVVLLFVIFGTLIHKTTLGSTKD